MLRGTAGLLAGHAPGLRQLLPWVSAAAGAIGGPAVAALPHTGCPTTAMSPPTAAAAAATPGTSHQQQHQQQRSFSATAASSAPSREEAGASASSSTGRSALPALQYQSTQLAQLTPTAVVQRLDRFIVSSAWSLSLPGNWLSLHAQLRARALAPSNTHAVLQTHTHTYTVTHMHHCTYIGQDEANKAVAVAFCNRWRSTQTDTY